MEKYNEIKRIFDVPYFQLKHYPQAEALVSKVKGKWVKTSIQEYLEKANQISKGLIKLGIEPGDKIAVISNNRTEWNILDIGISQIGAISVPVYPTITVEDYEYIFNNAEVKLCFVSDKELHHKANQTFEKVPTLKDIYSFEEVEGSKNWSEVLELGKEGDLTEVENRKSVIKATDLATMIYTSGTTGRPKGVMLSHNNLVSNVLASAKRVPLNQGKDIALSFLPICHVFERMILYLYQYFGVSIYFAESIEKLSENAQEIKPNVMTAVPRLYEKIYDKIYAKGEDLTGLKKKLFFWAINLGLKYEPYGVNGWWYEKQLGLARKLIFTKWQAALGGELKLMVSGSAALQTRLTRVFAAAGMPIMEGYGLTETSPVTSVNDQNNKGFKIGTVGRVIDGVEVKIADDGEILVKGPNVMMGYYKDPEKTAEVMSGDFFHTGDKGEIDADGMLKITGRKKEMFKTSGGKYVIPNLLENEFKQSLFIEQIMVVGEGEKMPAALIQPNFEYIRNWIEEENNGIGTSYEEIATSDIIIKKIQEEVAACNQKFGNWERIKRFELTPNIWSIDGGELTPTMKMKRAVIKKIYQDLYDKIYR